MQSLKKITAGVAITAIFLLSTISASAATYDLQPWTYDPDNTGDVLSQVTQDGYLRLEKNTDTSTNASAGAAIYGTEGLSTDNLTLSFQVEQINGTDGYCGAGAPRFNVYLENGQTIFLGCAHGYDPTTGVVTFETGESYGGVTIPDGETIQRIDIVMDEEGQTLLSNITVNGTEVEISENTLKVQCKNNGWKNFATITFKNQGQCVSYFRRSEQGNMNRNNGSDQNTPTVQQNTIRQ